LRGRGKAYKCVNCGHEQETDGANHVHIWMRLRCQTWAKFENPIFLFYCTRCPALKAREVILVDGPEGRRVRSKAYYLMFDKFEKVEGNDIEIPLYTRKDGDNVRVAETDIGGKKWETWKKDETPPKQ
jgi:hypothetical protein